MKQIDLGYGCAALVDDEDFEKVSRYRWYLWHRKGLSYAQLSSSGGGLKMHRLVIDAPAHLQVDHIDGNALNNQKGNLRLVTKSQNMLNRGAQRNNAIGLKGVSSVKGGRFTARITKEGKKYKLGSFDTPEEAHIAYCRAGEELHGEFFRTGKPKQPFAKTVPSGVRRPPSGNENRLRGSANKNAKFTESEMSTALWAMKYVQRKHVAWLLGSSKSLIDSLATKKVWAHLSRP